MQVVMEFMLVKENECIIGCMNVTCHDGVGQRAMSAGQGSETREKVTGVPQSYNFCLWWGRSRPLSSPFGNANDLQGLGFIGIKYMLNRWMEQQPALEEFHRKVRIV